MTLVDTGPLLALLDRDDDDHQACKEALLRVTEPMVTTLPVVVEAMYLLDERVGWVGQEALWSLILRGELRIQPMGTPEFQRARDLMAKYRDLPMDFADASLVAVAEVLDEACVFTLDGDFRIYRFRDRRTFDVLP